MVLELSFAQLRVTKHVKLKVDSTLVLREAGSWHAQFKPTSP
jgi:hypothetical protein